MADGTGLVTESVFPAGLHDWAGHRAGGVRRLFHAESGRPCGSVIETPLLKRLHGWAERLAANESGTPKIVLLVGGPGNGKTEAVESTIVRLDKLFGAEGRLIRAFESQFTPSDGSPIPRLARASLDALTGGRVRGKLSIVQDASVAQSNQLGLSPAAALVADLEGTAIDNPHAVYLACVNRGVLDHALIDAIERGRLQSRQLLETIIRSVALNAGAPACWPLHGYPHVAVWPMDVETLVGSPAQDGSHDSPAARLITEATRPDKWPAEGSCAAGERCPFCTSRGLLGRQPSREAFLRVLRWYELATGKRWSFRDLFSLMSYCLAGVAQNQNDRALTPCEWAASQTNLQASSSSRSEAAKLRVPFMLVASQYQHVLFGRWPRLGGRLRSDLKELKLQDEPTLLGLASFLSVARATSIPATLDAQLVGLCDALDPAIADPDSEVILSTRKTVKFRDIDARFSQSVGQGLSFVRTYLSRTEVDLLEGLGHADDRLSEADVRRRRPAVAKRVQVLVRDFACRLVRRSLGVRAGVVREFKVLDDFSRVVDGDETLLHEAVKQVEGLLNQQGRFIVTLNTTFGEPLPPESRRAVLTTGKQRVKAQELPTIDRPPAAVRFLLVGSGTSAQPIPLTYELFRSIRELKLGMLPASLPRPVVALLDTTRARLAGRVVRDIDALDGAEIHLGTRSEVVARELGKFVVRQERDA